MINIPVYYPVAQGTFTHMVKAQEIGVTSTLALKFAKALCDKLGADYNAFLESTNGQKLQDAGLLAFSGDEFACFDNKYYTTIRGATDKIAEMTEEDMSMWAVYDKFMTWYCRVYKAEMAPSMDLVEDIYASYVLGPHGWIIAKLEIPSNLIKNPESIGSTQSHIVEAPITMGYYMGFQPYK